MGSTQDTNAMRNTPMQSATSPGLAFPEPTDPERARAYRRLALTILGLDVPSLVSELRVDRPASLPPQLIDAA